MTPTRASAGHGHATARRSPGAPETAARRRTVYGNSPHVDELRRTGRVVDVSGHARVEELYLA
ncbi:hypothetical protein AB0B06_35030, partial [Streptomyces sp. NPDC044989]|uniref:hypothetical protein n=1 Tax=Streptomyces sp. NPDC044989 TaxID=3154336 RepID=UPI0033D7E881